MSKSSHHTATNNEGDDYEYEESPAATMMNQIENETYQINIGDQKVKFDVRDEIFTMNGPNLKQITSTQCHSCEKELPSKKPQYCQFCGHRACPNCMHKEQMFADHSTSGIICKICDRKFILYHKYKMYAQQISLKDQLIQQNQLLLNEAEKECLEKTDVFKGLYAQYNALQNTSNQ